MKFKTFIMVLFLIHSLLLKARVSGYVQFSYPGTLWCGPGNKTRSYDELGHRRDVDMCCRKHDLCSNYIDPGENKYGLINKNKFTQSSCECDMELYDCLRETNTVTGDRVAAIYFTLWGPQCFRNDFPIVACLRKRRGKCISYKLDVLAKEKIYQWFDNPKYSRRFTYTSFTVFGK